MQRLEDERSDNDNHPNVGGDTDDDTGDSCEHGEVDSDGDHDDYDDDHAAAAAAAAAVICNYCC